MSVDIIMTFIMSQTDYDILDALTDIMWRVVECDEPDCEICIERGMNVHAEGVQIVCDHVYSLGSLVREYGYEYCTTREFILSFLGLFIHKVDDDSDSDFTDSDSEFTDVSDIDEEPEPLPSDFESPLDDTTSEL